MSYEIYWHPNTRRLLRKLETKVSKRIINKIIKLKNNPFRYLEHYVGQSYFKLRIGDYRVLIDVDKKIKILKIMILDRRSRIYKR